MQPTIVDRTAIKAVVVDLLAQYFDAANPIFVAWDVGAIGLGDGRDYSRNEAGGGSVIMTVRNVQEVGIDQEVFDGNLNHIIVRRLILSIKITSDVFIERDLAVDIAETIRSRSFWPLWRARWQAAGLSVLRAISLVNASLTWDGRPVSFATLELSCLTSQVERDDDPLASDYATSAEATFQNG